MATGASGFRTLRVQSRCDDETPHGSCTFGRLVLNQRRSGTGNTRRQPDHGQPEWRRVGVVILILPNGIDDVARVNESAQVIAVIMPNRQNVNRKEWFDDRVTVDALEKLTGYDFFSNVADEIESVIEGKIDILSPV